MFDDEIIKTCRRTICPVMEYGRSGYQLKKDSGRLAGFCPACGSKNFFIYRKKDGQKYKCFGCGVAGDGIGMMMLVDGIGFGDAIQRAAERLGLVSPKDISPAEQARIAARQKAMQAKAEAAQRRRDEEYAAEMRKKFARAKAIWMAAQPIAPGDAVHQYLAGRGIDLVYLARVFAQNTGFDSIRIGALPYMGCAAGDLVDPGQVYPVMVAGISHGNEGMRGVHITYLAPSGTGKATIQKRDGTAASAKIMNGVVSGGMVRLGHVRSCGRVRQSLDIAEGIETALSVMMLGFRAARDVADVPPCWAALSLDNLSRVVIAPEIEKVRFFADPAPAPERPELVRSYHMVMARAVSNAIRRPRPAMPRKVELFTPSRHDGDFNDILLRGGGL